MPTHPTCGNCGFSLDPGATGRDRRSAVKFVDEDGADSICVLCAARLVMACDDGQIDITIVLAVRDRAVA